MAGLVGAAVAFSLAGWGTSELSNVMHGTAAKQEAEREYRRQVEAYNHELTQKHERNIDRRQQIVEADAQIILNRRNLANVEKTSIPPSYEKIFEKVRNKTNKNKVWLELGIFSGVVVATVVGYKLYK